MHIRPATEADIPAIAAIYAHAVIHGTASYEIDAPSAGQMAARMAALAGTGCPWIVAESDGRIAGYAYASRFRDRPAYRFLVEDSVYIAPDAQGKGFGKALLSRLVADCTAAGFIRMIAVIGDGKVNAASVALHRALGFSQCGLIAGSGFKHGRWLDTVLMQRDLAADSAALPSASDYPEHFSKPGA